ncbi:MAG: IMPACT family protein [Clostridia bacterium]|nr:IMPACT family protein [Clostridia bacterium]
MDGYRTLKTPGSGEFVVKKSRFVGHAAPTATEERALDFLAGVRANHRGANHNCYAYIIGRNEGIMRYSDDGEPGGTAGLPILEVMRARGVVDCCAVVTRYFGGVLLGAGGLTRAYAQGSKVAVDAAGIIVMEDSARLWVGVAYPLWGRVEHYLQNAPVLREGAEFGATVTATLLVRKRDLDSVRAELQRVCDGKADVAVVEELVHGW